jgi:hypothetical protein
MVGVRVCSVTDGPHLLVEVVFAATINTNKRHMSKAFFLHRKLRTQLKPDWLLAGARRRHRCDWSAP